MALKSLAGVKVIGGFPVVIMDELREKYPEKFNESGSMDYKWFEADVRPHNFVYIRHDVNSISFTIQNGPIKEVGVNGCQVDTLIEAAKMIIKKLNINHPCLENERAVLALNNALGALRDRKKAREEAGVEGTNANIPESEAAKETAPAEPTVESEAEEPKPEKPKKEKKNASKKKDD